MAAIRWAREQRVPFLGLCLGMQCAVIEWARNQAGLEGATSATFTAGPGLRSLVTMAAQRAMSLSWSARPSRSSTSRQRPSCSRVIGTA